MDRVFERQFVARATHCVGGTINILAISGSMRERSFNTHLAGLIAAARPHDRVDVVNDLGALPFFNEDAEARDTPLPVSRLRSAVGAADAVVFVTPEYNGTVPGLLANAVDWLSRPFRQSVLDGRTVTVLSASPSRFGGARAADHLRGVLARIGADVAPVGLSVSLAHERLHLPETDADLMAELIQVLDEALGSSMSGSGSHNSEGMRHASMYRESPAA